MFSGRNNIFLWATGWTYATFNVFHRNIARVATLEAIVHAISYSYLYRNGELRHVLSVSRAWLIFIARWLLVQVVEVDVVLHGYHGLLSCH